MNTVASIWSVSYETEFVNSTKKKINENIYRFFDQIYQVRFD